MHIMKNHYVTDSRVWRVLDWHLTVQLLSATLFLFTIWE